MPTVDEVTAFLDRFAPAELAADWDNVGLLLGDRQGAVERVMTCLTVTPRSAAEAVRERANLIVTHHPLPFRPLRRLTTDAHEGRLLWELARAGISIYSPHTAFDSTRGGINQQLAEGIGLREIAPLVPTESEVGTGRRGRLDPPCNLGELAERVKKLLHLELLQVAGASAKPIERVAVACGSAGELLPAAVAAGCDCLLTGEMRFHGCLEAEAQGIALVLAGH
ncbi:MAG: Nif3-like dinuclear metal center hexameric protein, partial [Planctomycetaceae bacterium]|nr:Nif3-like dinuclear metal center hexameric protein [Planctomycetaceae bacterium]